MAIFVNNGLDKITRYFLGIDDAIGFTLRIFQNSLVPSVLTSVSDLTECTLAGYAAVPVVPGNWSGSTSSGVSTYTYPQVQWNFSAYGGGTYLFGYYATNNVDGSLIWIEAWTTPFLVPNTGGGLNLDITEFSLNF